ncbi:MAG: hypothetical protein ACREOW_07850 [Thermodesulfobacteriota bacterium]
MSFARIRITKIFVFTIAIFLLLTFASFIVLSRVILPQKIHGYIEAVFKNKDYEIEIKEIGFNILSGFVGNEIRVFEKHSPGSPIISVPKVEVKPDILSSLIKREIRIRGIEIHNPVILYSKEELEKLKRLITQYEEIKKREQKKFLHTEVEHIEIINAEIKLSPELSLHSEKLIIDFLDAELKQEKTINLSGVINIQNNKIEIKGQIKPFLDTPFIEIKLTANELNMGIFSNAFQSSVKLDVVSLVSFQISDKITSQGVVDIKPKGADGGEGSPFLGKMEYDITYDEITENAFVNSLTLNIYDLIHVSFVGVIENLLGEGTFNLEGRGEQVQLEKVEKISKWFPAISQVKISGSVDPNDVKIVGSIKGKDVTLSGRISLNGVNINDNKYGFNLNGIEGVYDFKKPLYDHTTLGFYAEGKVSLRQVLTNILNINNVTGRMELTSSGKEITLKSDGLYWGSFSNNVVKSGKGQLKGLIFNLDENNDWSLNMSSNGSELLVFDEGFSFKSYQAEINKDKNGKSGISGTVIGKDANYKDIFFPNIYADLNLNDDVLKLTNVKMQIRRYGEFRTTNLSIVLNQGKGVPYKLEFTQGSFTGLNKNIESKGIGGRFSFYIDKSKIRWNGSIFINESNFYKSKLTNLSFEIKPSRDAFSLEKISGRFLGGNLKGSALIRRIESSTIFSSQLEFENAFIHSDKFELSLGRVDIEYKGELGKSLLPQGSGRVKLSDLTIGNFDKATAMGVQIELKTVGETFIIENGFIQDKGRAKVHFTGRMENSLNGNRRLHLDILDFPLVLIKTIFAPLLPKVISDGQVKGSASLSLTSNHFLQEEYSFDGRLSIKGVSFTGKYNDNYFYINGIDGTILLKDKIKPDNPLSSLMGEHLTLDQRVFRGFIDTVTPDYLNKERKILSIREVEYGFLRIEDIECEVELDSTKLNLRGFQSALYEGEVFGTGLLDFNGGGPKYSISLVFKDISLKSISDSIPPIKDYITGRINGIIWLTGEGKKLNSIDGPFHFWSLKSKKEDRRIGKAFLQKLGAKEKFFFGTTRKYDNAELYGYIKDGVITFKELDILHSIFGFKDLSVKVDKKRNSISAAHFLSIIREMARRAGRLKIEFGK